MLERAPFHTAGSARRYCSPACRMLGTTSAATALLTLAAQQQLVLHLQPVADGVGVLVQPGGHIHTAGRGQRDIVKPGAGGGILKQPPPAGSGEQQKQRPTGKSLTGNQWQEQRSNAV